MSFFKLRQYRRFGEFHKIFPPKSINPNERVEPKFAYNEYVKIDKLRKQRMWIFMQKEKLDQKIEKQVLRKKEDHDLLKPSDKRKEQRYFDERGLVGLEDEVSEFLDIDRDTLLPYGAGFDSIVRELKEKKLGEASQDEIRDIWMKLGFTSTIQVINSVKTSQLKESLEKINRRIYTSRHKIEPMAYTNIEDQEDPRSQQRLSNEPEYFSDDFSGQSASDTEKNEIRKIKLKYIDKLSESDITVTDNDAEFGERNESLSSELEGKRQNTNVDVPNLRNSPMFPLGKVRDEINYIRKKHKLTAFRNAVKQMKQSKKAFDRPKFLVTLPNEYLKYHDYMFNIKKYKGFAPSFRDIVVEAEKFILKEPKLKVLMQRDEYEKNKHFEPRYLNKQLTPEDFYWSFTPKPKDALYPGYISGKLPFRESHEDLVDLVNLQNKNLSEGYRPDPKDMSLRVYSMVKNDPFHMHFLNNHVKYWNESILEAAAARPFNATNKSKPLIPWEYINLPRLKVIKSPPNSKPILDPEGYATAHGKRKDAKAFAKVKEGLGIITINGKSLLNYCPLFIQRNRIIQPFRATRLTGCLDAVVSVQGGGCMGQSQAIQLAISRAIVKYYPASQKALHEFDMLTRDPRQVERKKTSKYKARKSYTFVKR